MIPDPKSEIRNPKSLIVICGPTAVGKTAVAISLAQYFRTEILSVDSRQFYREMNIGTAKPSAAELAVVPHHFINNLSIHDTYTAGDYEKEALAVLDRTFKSADIAVMVGGSGLFIRAVCEGFDDFQGDGNQISEEIKNKVRQMALTEMQMELSRLDPVYYATVDINNPRRLQRALQVIYSTGHTYSAQRTGAKAERNFKIVKIGIELPREHLYSRINMRVDEMVKNGLVAEATALYPYRHLQTLQTVGYQEIFDHLDNKCSLPEAIEKIKLNTRHYAKRQMTWFKKDKEIQWLEAAELMGKFAVDDAMPIEQAREYSKKLIRKWSADKHFFDI